MVTGRGSAAAAERTNVIGHSRFCPTVTFATAEIDGPGGRIVRLRLLAVAACCGIDESATETLMDVNVPIVAGTPLMTPVVGAIASPRGSPVAENVNGGVPPVAVTVALYGIPCIAGGSDGGVISNSGAITMESVVLAVRWVGFVESVTVITPELVPARLGVPLITPPALIESPAGKPVAVKV
jgi:hypothetical protein